MNTDHPTPRRARRLGATAAVITLSAALSLAPTAAFADDAELVSWARGQFLSGSLVGVDLAAVVELAAAEASNDGSTPLVTSRDPLSATAVQTVTVEAEGGIQTDLGSGADVGAVAQYAEAADDGTSMGASGAIGDDGAIGVGAVGDPAAGDLSLDLNAVLGSRFASVFSALSLDLDAVAAQAVADLDVASGDYRLAGARLTFASPAIADLSEKVRAALTDAETSLLDLESQDGILGLALDEVLDPILGVVGSSADVSVSLSADLDSAVSSLLTSRYSENGVTFDLEAGTVSIDLDALTGGDLNNLPPNTELLSGAVLGPVLDSITETVRGLAASILDRVETALHDATLDVRASADLLTSQGTTSSTVCEVVDVPVIGEILGGVLGDGTSGSGLLGGGLLGGGLVGGGTGGAPEQGIIGWTTETVCDVVRTALPSLRSTLDVALTGTVDEFIAGAGVDATAQASLLGGTLTPTVDVNLAIDGLGDGLTAGLFGTGGLVDDLAGALDTRLVRPAELGLLGTDAVEGALTDALSVTVNVPELSDGTFTQTAVRVAALGTSAVVNVAAASVGPNVTGVDGPCTVDCGPDDGCVTGCGTPVTTASGHGGLAFTGLGLTWLIGLLAGLITVGVLMLREHLRQTRVTGIPGA